MKTRTNLTLLALAVLALVAVQPVHAAIWNKTATGTYSWNDDANWTSPATFPNAADDVANLEINIASNQTINLNQAITVGTLQIGDTSGAQTYTLAPNGGSLTLDVTSGNATLSRAAGGTGAVTISSAITMNDPLDITNNSGGTMTLSGGITNGGNLLTLGGSGTIDMASSVISGAGGLTKNGTGTLSIRSSTNSYTGTTTLNGGVTRIQSNLNPGPLTFNGGVLEDYWGLNFTRSLGDGAGQVQITGGASGFSENGTGGTVKINNSSSYQVVWGSTYFNPSALVLQAATAQANTIRNSSLSFQNPIDLNGATRTIAVDQIDTQGIRGNGATITGAITTGTGTAGLIKTGVGRLTLTATNTYNGGTTISGGTLRFTKLVSMPASGAVAVNTGTTLGVYVGGTGEWTTGTSGEGTLGGLLAGLGSQSGSTVTYSGNVGLDLVTSGTQTFAGDIANVGTSLSITKLGTGTLALSGTNTYTGPTTVTAGTLSVGAIANLGAAAANLVLEGGTLQITGTTLTNFSGIGHTVSFVADKAVGLDIADAANTFTVNQVLNQATGSFTKLGAGTAILNQVNTYTGNTYANAGTLIAGTNALNNANGAFGKQNNVDLNLGVANGNNDASILIGGAFTIGRIIRNATSNTTDAGTRVLTLGGNTAANSTFSGNIILGTTNQTSKGVTLTAASGGQVTFSGVIQNPTGQDASEAAAAATLVAVTKAGLGTVLLTNANTYTGATTVNAGTLLVTNTSGSGTGTGAVTVNGGTLGGGGIITGAVNVNSAGTLAPGASIGTLKVGATTIDGTLLVDVNTLGGSDLLEVTGDLTLGGGSILTIVDPGQLDIAYTYAIATYTGNLTGTFGSDNLGAWFVDYGSMTPNTITLVPEPATMALMALGGLGLILGRKRR